jgi:hypothetical protein
MARFETFAQDLKLATQGLAPESIERELAQFAKRELAQAISSGSGRSVYERFVNGRRGAVEEQVIAPGPILYVFSWWPEIIRFGLESLIARSPEKSGDFKRGWFVMVNDAVVSDYDTIPVDATVTLTNRQPYSRKIEVGHMRMSVPHGVAEDVRGMVSRQYGAIVSVQKKMILLPNGYVLKGRFRRGYREHARAGLQKDTQRGQPVTYPALVMSVKVA